MDEKARTNENASRDSMATVAEKAPVTAQRKVRADLETKLPKPCIHLSHSSSSVSANPVVLCSLSICENAYLT